MKWVTWENVGVDRIGCAWLIRREIDSQAEFVFIPYGTRPSKSDGQPFDIPGARFSHRRGHCSFSTFLQEYKIDDPVLRRIARIVDEADTIQDARVEPVAAGLDYICEGIRLAAGDDHVALERGALIYEALYSRIRSESSKE